MAAFVAVSCGHGLPLSPSGTGAGTTATQAELAYCATQINGYRRSIGLTALQQSQALEAFAATVRSAAESS